MVAQSASNRRRVAPRIRSRGRLLSALVVAVSLYLLFPWRLGVVQGESMSPSLHPGQLYLLDRTYYRRHEPQRGDIIVFRHQGTILTKRIYAVPGDVVALLHHPLEESDWLLTPRMEERIARLERSGRLRDGARIIHVKVPEGHYFVLGDHEHQSIDSRAFGMVPREAILGKMVAPSPARPAPDTRLVRYPLPPLPERTVH